MRANRRNLFTLALGAMGSIAAGQMFARPAFAADEDTCDALFVLSARSISTDGASMTLHGANKNLVYFCDRPVREAGHLTLEALSEIAQMGENSFAENPPNAAVSVFQDDGTVQEAVVTLPTAPRIDGDTVVFEFTALDGTLPAKGGAVSVFIDPMGVPMSPTSVAGVHRRHRRRAIRRHN